MVHYGLNLVILQVLVASILVGIVVDPIVELTKEIIVEVVILFEIGCLFSQFNPTPSPTPKAMPIDKITIKRAPQKQQQHAAPVAVDAPRSLSIFNVS